MFSDNTIPASSAIHELRAPEATAAHAAFAALLLGWAAKTAPILWVSVQSLACYPPGLAYLGLDPARCLFAQARDDAECLGTLEVALRGGMAGVAECGALSRLAARRLALAAKTGGGIGFVLRHAPAFTANDSTAFATRWLISPAPSAVAGIPRLRAELLYAKAGRPGEFLYEIREVNDGQALSLALLDGELAAGQRRAG
jgi:protein ImuA